MYLKLKIGGGGGGGYFETDIQATINRIIQII